MNFILKGAFILLILMSCSTSDKNVGPTSKSTKKANPSLQKERDLLRVMSFNIFWGGRINFDKVVEVIRLADPDIVGVQESRLRIRKLAKKLGYPHYSQRARILSKYPLGRKTRWRGRIIHIDNGRKLQFYNLHLAPYPYGPEMIKEGKLESEVRANENKVRLKELSKWGKYFKKAKSVVGSVPIIVTGDFNAPSHLDWVPETKSIHFNSTFDWPTSRFMTNFGFKDSYREVWPNVRNKPGFTWTPGRPAPKLKPGTIFDRIDFIYYMGPSLRPTNSFLIGHDKNNISSDFEVRPFPSDHRALVTDFEIR